MNPPTTAVSRRTHLSEPLPSYLAHPDFDTQAGRKALDPAELLANGTDHEASHMPDDVTRDHSRRMHYAAHRMHRARTGADLAKWQKVYLTLRDRIVLGNRKLIFRAVRRRMAVSNRADDLIGDCHIVLIQAVAAYNPWIGVRFSTYAYTCLVRALSRLSQRSSNDWLTRAVSLDALPDGVPGGFVPEVRGVTGQVRLDEFFREDHPLLSPREKMILARRFAGEDAANQTLEKVGRSVGLSKERVRQVQASALGKLRKALAVPPPPAN